MTGHFKIKEYHHIFLEPLVSQQKVKVNIPAKPDGSQQQQEQHLASDHHHHISDDQVAAAVDAAIKTVPVAPDVNCYNNAAVTVDTVMNTAATDIGLSVADAAQAALAAAPEHTQV